MKMYAAETLRKFINPPIEISELRLSYIERLFPEYKGSPCTVLHKVQPRSKNVRHEEKYVHEDETSEFDITGSPLKYTLEESNFDDTIMALKKYWYKEDEEYFPISREESCYLLNTCLAHLKEICSPIFTLCDGKDKRNSRLMGTVVDGEWFTTIEAYSAGTEKLSVMKNLPLKPLQEHLQLSAVQEYKVTVSACNIFELFGTKAETTDWKETEMCNFEGCLSVEVDTSNLSLDPPTRASKNNLVMQIASGFNGSLLKNLWIELKLLDQYLTFIEEYKNDHTASQYNSMPLQFPDNFKSPYAEEDDKIIEHLNSLLNGDYTYREVNTDVQDMKFMHETSIEENILLEQYIEKHKCRHTLDFTDFFWELLIKNEKYIHIVKCIHIVLTDILSRGCLTQVNLSNTTRFAKIICNSNSQKNISHLLLGSLPLEYVVDMGLEKLHRDYAYILTNAGFSEGHEYKKLRNVSSEEFSVDAYRKRLMYMAQIHICLEFMLLLQSNFPCPTDHMNMLFSNAFKQFVSEESPIRNHLDLHKNTIYNLTAPAPVFIINGMSKERPVTRRISLSSETTVSRVTTIRYYSRLPIFPTMIFPSDDTNANDELYHVIKCNCLAKKFK